MAALADEPDLVARISRDLRAAGISHGVLKTLWWRAKDVADLQALAALSESLDRGYVLRTVAALLPGADPRHAELARLLDCFGPGP